MRPDEDISRRYRDLAREEPGTALDGAILAASRRAVHRPATRRWAVPVSIAAVLVLSIGLTMEMQREEPDIATSIPQRSAAPPPPAAAESQSVAPAAKDLAAPAPSMRRAVRPKAAAPPPKPRRVPGNRSAPSSTRCARRNRRPRPRRAGLRHRTGSCRARRSRSRRMSRPK